MYDLMRAEPGKRFDDAQEIAVNTLGRISSDIERATDDVLDEIANARVALGDPECGFTVEDALDDAEEKAREIYALRDAVGDAAENFPYPEREDYIPLRLLLDAIADVDRGVLDFSELMSGAYRIVAAHVASQDERDEL